MWSSPSLLYQDSPLVVGVVASRSFSMGPHPGPHQPVLSSLSPTAHSGHPLSSVRLLSTHAYSSFKQVATLSFDHSPVKATQSLTNSGVFICTAAGLEVMSHAAVPIIMVLLKLQSPCKSTSMGVGANAVPPRPSTYSTINGRTQTGFILLCPVSNDLISYLSVVPTCLGDLVDILARLGGTFEE